MRKNWAALALTGMLCLTTFAGTQTVSAETADSEKHFKTRKTTNGWHV